MSSAPTADEIWKDARWLAQAVDPRAGLVRLVEMTAEDYRDASFLDDRMFESRERVTHLLPWATVADVSGRAQQDARWIFHISHVGSTLISRLLGELDGVLSVREPRALRDLTFFPKDVRAQFESTVGSLYSRTFGPDEKAVIKATSFVNEIAGELLQNGQPALFLYTTPRSFIAGLLAGGNSRQDLVGKAELRAARLAARGVSLPAPKHEADYAATAWACEMIALEATDGPNVMWSDFDQCLDDLEASLGRMAGFLRLSSTPQQLRDISNGPLTRRYSKALQYDYSPDLRRQLLTEAAEKHRADIESALAMLDAAAETAPLLRKALDRAQAES